MIVPHTTLYDVWSVGPTHACLENGDDISFMPVLLGTNSHDYLEK